MCVCILEPGKEMGVHLGVESSHAEGTLKVYEQLEDNTGCGNLAEGRDYLE